MQTWLARRWRALWIAAAAAALAAWTAVATASGEDVPLLDLATAIERTLARNPDLAGFTYRLRAQAGALDTAGLPPPLTLSADIEDAFGTGRTRALDAAETTFAISRVIELGDKRALRVAAARSSTRLVEVERAAAELDVLAEVTRRFIHVAADQEQLALTEVATALAQETVERAAARVAAARTPEVEVRRARVSLARAQVEHEHAEHELASSRRKLAAMWGDTSATYGTVVGDLYALPEPAPYESLVARLAANPDFVRFASEARLRDAERQLALAHARGDLQVTAGMKRLEQGDDQALVLGVTMPLGSARRARGAIDTTTAQRALTDAEAAAHRVRAEAELFELYQELVHAITEATVLRTDVLPEIEAALAAARTAFELGRYGYLEWVDAQRELIDVRRALIDAAANAHVYLAEIERLTAEPLAGKGERQ